MRETSSPLQISQSLIVDLQSMDRANTERSPVFYLEPIDWIRTGLRSDILIIRKSVKQTIIIRGILSSPLQGEDADQGAGGAGR